MMHRELTHLSDAIAKNLKEEDAKLFTSSFDKYKSDDRDFSKVYLHFMHWLLTDFLSLRVIDKVKECEVDVEEKELVKRAVRMLEKAIIYEAGFRLDPHHLLIDEARNLSIKMWNISWTVSAAAVAVQFAIEAAATNIPHARADFVLFATEWAMRSCDFACYAPSRKGPDVYSWKILSDKLLELVSKKVLLPGSAEAQENGCKCPSIDNCHGKGRGGDGERFGWVVSGNCELHWEDKREK